MTYLFDLVILICSCQVAAGDDPLHPTLALLELLPMLASRGVLVQGASPENDTESKR